jgi:hypothetical protein
VSVQFAQVRVAPRARWRVYVRPNYAIQDTNAAGKRIAKVLLAPTAAEFEEGRKTWGPSIDIVNNFRASHACPLNSFWVTLNKRASRINQKAITVQRLKRMRSIAGKLMNREDMKLSQMQDIGGCRSIMPTLADVYALRDLYINEPVSHVYGGQKDYIHDPKPSGYRGIHLKYRFTGKGTTLPWNNLKIEIQLRTLVQHRWATAVEAIGAFTSQALKSSQGDDHWLRFFVLMSSVYAMNEGCKTVPNTPTDLEQLYAEIRALNENHRIQETFGEYRKIIPTIAKKKGAKYFLVTLDVSNKTVSVEGYKDEESRSANTAYTESETELDQSRKNIVLVSARTIKQLEKAYPNYFMDTHDFLRDMAAITGKPV